MDMTLPNWERANCLGADPEAFFPTSGLTSELQAAKRICSACPIIDECAEWAIRHEPDGLWGGLMPQARQRIRLQRGVTVDPPHHALLYRDIRRAS